MNFLQKIFAFSFESRKQMKKGKKYSKIPPTVTENNIISVHIEPQIVFPFPAGDYPQYVLFCVTYCSAGGSCPVVSSGVEISSGGVISSVILDVSVIESFPVTAGTSVESGV